MPSPTVPAHRRTRRLATAAGLAALMALGVTTVPAGAQQAPKPMDYTAPCVPVELVAARGTFDPGALGVIVADPLAAALEGRFAAGRVRSTAVDYPANVQANSLALGIFVTVLYVKARAYQCPQTRFVLSGYSQGAMVINGAIGAPALSSAGYPKLSAATGAKVVSVLLFGNPLYNPAGPTTGDAYADKTRDSCYEPGGPRLDPVCGGSGTFNDHVRYVLGDSAAAADFPAQKLYQSCWPTLIYTDARCKATYWP